jgi:hypothetical protein
MSRAEISHIHLRLPRAQRDAVQRLAEKRDTNATALLRDVIANLTGIADTMPRYGRLDTPSRNPYSRQEE